MVYGSYTQSGQLVLYESAYKNVTRSLMNVCPSLVTEFVQWVWLLTVRHPLAMLYLYGPAWMGGWSGKPIQDICAQMTHVESSFWEDNIDTCNELVVTSFDSFYVTLGVIVYFLIILRVLVRII